MKSTNYNKKSIAASLLMSLLLWSAPASAKLALDVPSSAYGAGAYHEGTPHVEARLVVDASQVAPGDTIRVGVAFDLAHAWHIYWQNPGDAGAPTRITWQGEQLEFGPLQWSAPHTYDEADGAFTVYGYGDEVVLFSEAKVSPTAQGSIEITAQIEYMACHEMCLPGESTLSRRLPVGEVRLPAEATTLQAMDRFEALVPQPPSAFDMETTFHYSRSGIAPGDRFEALVELIACGDGAEREACRVAEFERADLERLFIPEDPAAPRVEIVEVTPHPSAPLGWLIRLRGELPAAIANPSDRISGVVQLVDARGTSHALSLNGTYPLVKKGEITKEQALPSFGDAPLTPKMPSISSGAAAPGSAPAPEAPVSFLAMVALAFFGGILLNFMPCVFPVLALKLSSFTQLVHESRRSLTSHSAAYASGIVGSMMVLAGVVIALQAAGTQVGWGFQFQSGGFLAALSVILVLFSLNLFGVFEVMASADRLHEKADGAHGVSRSFWEGVLAVVLATPCSAPLLGTAVGFALSSGPLAILAIFTALGLGLAAPLIVLAFLPGWAKVLPRPGNWMLHLKSALGFALLGSGVWIVWLLGRQRGADGMGAMLGFLLVLSLSAWLYGKVQFERWGKKKIAVSVLALGLTGGAAAVVFPLPERVQASENTEQKSGLAWQTWSDEAVKQALAEGHPVFVDFTADWCLTCKVNERQAIDTEEVRQAIAAQDVTLFKADWTHPDETIRQKLATFGRAGVPFYLVYSPHRPDAPQTLPEVLTASSLRRALESASVK